MDWKADLKKIRFSMERGEERYFKHADLVRACRLSPPRDPQPYVTSFTGWLFDVMHPHFSGADRVLAKTQGQTGERAIELDYRLSLPQPMTGREWELVFADPLTRRVVPFAISELTIGGSPMRGVPDVVLRNRKGEITIIERKITRRDVPDQGWPNLKAQLWCYGLIDDFKHAPEVYLVGEIWERSGGRLQRSGVVPRWSRSEGPFDRDCAELFAIFGGMRRGR